MANSSGRDRNLNQTTSDNTFGFATPTDVNAGNHLENTPYEVSSATVLWMLQNMLDPMKTELKNEIIDKVGNLENQARTFVTIIAWGIGILIAISAICIPMAINGVTDQVKKVGDDVQTMQKDVTVIKTQCIIDNPNLTRVFSETSD